MSLKDVRAGTTLLSLPFGPDQVAPLHLFFDDPSRPGKKERADLLIQKAFDDGLRGVKTCIDVFKQLHDVQCAWSKE